MANAEFGTSDAIVLHVNVHVSDVARSRKSSKVLTRCLTLHLVGAC